MFTGRCIHDTCPGVISLRANIENKLNYFSHAQAQRHQGVERAERLNPLIWEAVDMLYVIKRHDLPSLPQGLVVATNSFYINDWTVGHSSSEKANTSAERKALTTYGLTPSL